MKFSFWRLATPAFDGEGGGAGAPPAGGDPAAGGSGGNGGGAPASGAPGGGAPAGAPGAGGGQPPAGGSPKAFTYQEDRSNWVPPHVQRRYVSEAEKLRRDLELATSRVAALSGVQPPPARVDPEQEQLRSALFQLVPGLQDLLGHADLLKSLKELNIPEVIPQLRDAQNQSWVQRGTAALNELSNAVRESYGAAGKDLSPKALQRIQRAFISELEHDEEMRGRYEAGDPDVISDFVKDFTGVVLDPYRRSHAAAAQTPGQVAARRLPRGGGGAPAVGAGAPRTVKPADGDAFHTAAFGRFQQSQ